MKTIFVALAAFSTLLTFTVAATPVFAASTPVYRLVPVAAAAPGTVIVRDTLWKCGPSGCTAAQANSRPAIICAQAAKKVGKLTSFAVSGVEFDAAAIEACNAKAK